LTQSKLDLNDLDLLVKIDKKISLLEFIEIQQELELQHFALCFLATVLDRVMRSVLCAWESLCPELRVWSYPWLV